jgi:putative flavoprotein involved in K+ transport
MTRVDTVVIGAGQAGLALSRCLTDAGRDHVVLDRGRVAERWRSERWDSFRLLTPNWQTRLPGWSYRGPDPDGFMCRDEIVRFFDGYARSFAAPVRGGVDVRRVARSGDGWRVDTSSASYDARNVVVATGHYGQPAIPAVGRDLPADLLQIAGRDYRNPQTLPDGGVLVVGAGPTGQQIADELARAGRRVILAVGRHRPLPRRYRDHDVYWWLDRMGSLNRTVDTLDDPGAAAGAPSVVLEGGDDDLHLRRLVGHGVVPVGHLRGVDAGRVRFAPDLAATVAAADAHPAKFRAQVDACVDTLGLSAPREDVDAQTLPRWATDAPTELWVAGSRHVGQGLAAVVWATGYRRDYSFIDAPVFDPTGEPVQRRGVTAAPGLFFLGLRFMHRRNSNFIDGVGADAAYLAQRITGIADATDVHADETFAVA